MDSSGFFVKTTRNASERKIYQLEKRAGLLCGTRTIITATRGRRTKKRLQDYWHSGLIEKGSSKGEKSNYR